MECIVVDRYTVVCAVGIACISRHASHYANFSQSSATTGTSIVLNYHMIPIFVMGVVLTHMFLLSLGACEIKIVVFNFRFFYQGQ